MPTFFPSIWLGEFRSRAEFDRNACELMAAFSVYDWIDTVCSIPDTLLPIRLIAQHVSRSRTSR